MLYACIKITKYLEFQCIVNIYFDILPNIIIKCYMLCIKCYMLYSKYYNAITSYMWMLLPHICEWINGNKFCSLKN